MYSFKVDLFAPEEEQIETILQIRSCFQDSSPKKKMKIYLFVTDAISNIDNYSYKVASNIVFIYQDIEQDLTLEQKIESFKNLLELCKNNLFKKKYSFSNAVSITLRTFISDPKFPKNEVSNGYFYLLKNMTPISRGFGSNRCQLCWNKTFHDFQDALGICRTPDTEAEIYRITNLNVFQRQLKSSYDRQLNELMNDFYKSFFSDAQEIIVHDATSTDPNVKKLDKRLQKQGIDKTILLKNGKKCTIEEKFREPKFWNNRSTDILLEYISIDKDDIPGWVYTSKADYLVILYKNESIEESQVYVFPFNPIREWVMHNDLKFKSYPDVVAHNTNWNTISKIVPVNDIFMMLSGKPAKFSKIHQLK